MLAYHNEQLSSKFLRLTILYFVGVSTPQNESDEDGGKAIEI